MGRTVLLGLGLLALAVVASPADAVVPVITGSSISTPANGAELFYNGDDGSGNVTVRGTVSSAGTGSRGDIRCYSAGDSTSSRLAAGVDVSSGSFSAVVPLAAVAGEACRLRMVPAGATPTGTAAAPFAGPAVSISDLYSHSSTGNLYGYYVLTGSLYWSFAFQSLGECPVTASYETTTPQLGSFQLFAGGACLPELSGIAPNFRSRSSLQVDGLNAYPPAAIAPQTGQQNPNLTSVAGFEPLQYSASFDANHDTVSISESDTPTICNPALAFPPSAATCPGLRDSGIRITQTSTLLAGGQVARLSEQFHNVDSRAHTVDVLFSNSVDAPGAGLRPGFEFPGQPSFAAHAEPDAFNEFGSGAGSIIVIGDSTSQPSLTNPVGAITYSTPPLSADFLSSTGSQTATFTLHYVATIPAGGSVTYGWSYSQSNSATGIEALEAVERDRYYRPSVSITHPRRRLVTGDPHLRVSGRVSDPVGLRSVTINGLPVPLSPGGTYVATIRLVPGRHRVTAVVTNVAGNTASVWRTVTYRPSPCRVPPLRGLQLSRARTKLRGVDCTPGRVIRVRSRAVRRGRVVGSRPGAGARRRPFAHVTLFVSRGR